MAPILLPDTAVHGEELEFDFSSVKVGVTECGLGPTGVTVIHFPNKAKAAVDVRGGLPGTYNVDFLRLGYDFPSLDAIGISGGSWYGLQSVSGIATAMKEDGTHTGHHTQVANITGAIIYDFGDRRLNEIYPDAALGAAAFRSARQGVFPLGSHGAGRMAVQGMFYGLPLHSGQGAAFRRIGKVKLAAFVVANPFGLIADRDGRIVNGGQHLPGGISHISDALRMLPLPRDPSGLVLNSDSGQVQPNPANTTISVIVTNLKLPFFSLQRLGLQTHSSMGRAIQPFATPLDGDVLFATSTDEVEDPSVDLTELGTFAGEVMWDALLSVTTPRQTPALDCVIRTDLGQIDSSFVFDQGFAIKIRRNQDRLRIEVIGKRTIFGLSKGTVLTARIDDDGRFETVGKGASALRNGAFLADKNRVIHQVVLNLGAWQQTGNIT